MSEQDEEKSPNSLRYYAPRRSRESGALEAARPELAPPATDVAARAEPVVAPGGEGRRDVFSEAVARAERQRLDPEFVAAPAFAEGRSARGIGVGLAVVTTAGLLAALAYTVAFPMPGVKSQAVAAWSSLTAGHPRPPPPTPVSTLIVRGNSGPLNAQLDLGVAVEHAAPGMVVLISKVPPGARITAGRRIGNGEEWRVPSMDVADAAIVPPIDFAGELNLPLELHDATGATLVKSFVRLSWAAPPSPVVVTGSTPAAEAKAVPQDAAPVPPVAAATAAVPPAAPADPVLAWTPNEVAGFVRRAQELLASGEVQAARLQLLRAAEARDPRAALLLAKTFDPVSLKQFGVADAGTDLAQARMWYQRAREWGSPEAQRQLDALASYPRR
ncbi:hypothetical protein SSBR45G_58210 [Bradyrhizobium sp. SSBR45G]|nr:hypothetical protein SSBR45G_58210 [Bradyrhizobium sp. SSBR45G]GLH88384.1 hypothetical protein SSBR45R_58450 [Bradyrhizobium sp. SSBR45R]